MADNYLITGYWGEPHITAENDRGINAAIFGTGRYVLPVGKQFKAEYIGNNTIRIYDGKLINNGAAAGIPAGEYVDLLIANAGQGMKRNDFIVFQYEKDASTLVESGKFVVVQGTEKSGTATDPALKQEDLLSNEATFDQYALWRVSVSGTAISAPVKVFNVKSINGDILSLDNKLNLYANSLREHLQETMVSADGTDGNWTYRAWTSGIFECWGIVNATVTANMDAADPFKLVICRLPLPSGITEVTEVSFVSAEPLLLPVYATNEILSDSNSIAIGFYCVSTETDDFRTGVQVPVNVHLFGKNK